MDLRTTSRETLLEVIAKQQTIIAELERRVKELEARPGTGRPVCRDAGQ